MQRYVQTFFGYGLRRYRPYDAFSITGLSSFWNGEQAALPATVREYFREVNPNGGWVLELDQRPEAVFEVHLLSRPLAHVIRECPYERDKTARHLLTPQQAVDSSIPAAGWIELATANADRAAVALMAAIPFILRTLRPFPHRDDVIAGLLHTHFRRLPQVRRALKLQPTDLRYPNYSDVVHVAPLREAVNALEKRYWQTN